MHRKYKNPVFVSILTFTTGALGLLWKASCANTGWGSSVETYTRLCYSDVGPLYVVRGFANGVIPYLDQFNERYLEYPVLTGFWMWITAFISQQTLNPLAAFVYLTWITSALLIAAGGYLLSKLRSERAVWFALSPAVFLTLGINWDAAAVFFMLLALHFFRSGKLPAAGIAVGIGTAFKLFPILLLVPFLVDAIRHRKLRSYPKLAGWTIGSWLIINLPIYLLNSNGWWEFYRFSQNRGVDFGSFWLGLRYLFDINFSTESVNFYSSVIMLVIAIVLILSAKRLDLFTAAFIFIGAFALFNKVYSPQFVLWLTPLAALSAVRLREFVIWQIAQVIYFVGVWRHLVFILDSSASGGINNQIYALTIALHFITTAALIGISYVRSIKSGGFSGRLVR